MDNGQEAKSWCFCQKYNLEFAGRSRWDRNRGIDKNGAQIKENLQIKNKATKVGEFCVAVKRLRH